MIPKYDEYEFGCNTTAMDCGITLQSQTGIENFAFNSEYDEIGDPTFFYPRYKRYNIDKPKFSTKKISDFELVLNRSSGIDEISPDQILPRIKNYHMTELITSFINKNKKTRRLRKPIDFISNKIYDYLITQKIRTEIIVDLEVDSEYDDWVEPVIKIMVDSSDFEKVYSLYDVMLSHSLKKLKGKISEKIMISVDINE